AALDAPHRSRSIAVGAKQSSTTVETASLSTIDKRFVRRQIFEEYILDAAKCALDRKTAKFRFIQPIFDA
ncbi:MAG: hypothetical protein DMG30_29340, partial [Acidobacteria bacterium]